MPNTSESVDGNGKFETFVFDSFPNIVVPIIFAIVTVIGFVGNAMVILVYFLFKAMRDTTNTLIVNLAFADLMFVSFCVPITAVQYSMTVWPFPDIFCKIVSYIQQVSAHASVWLLFCLAADRFLAVVYPFVAIRFRCMRTALIACMTVWICVIVINAPLLHMFQVLKYEFNDTDGLPEKREMCLHLRKWEQVESVWVIYVLYFGYALLGFVVPLGITVLLYIWMIRRLWYNPFGKYSQKAGSDEDHPSRAAVPRRASNDNIRAKKRITLMVLSVTIVFAVCWMPQIIRSIIDVMSYKKPSQSHSPLTLLLQVLAQVMGYANSCLNPILYGALSENYKKGFINFFGMIRGRKPKHKIRRLTRPLLEELSRPAVMCALHAASDRRKQQLHQEDQLIEQTAFHDAADDDEDRHEDNEHEVDIELGELRQEEASVLVDSEQHLATSDDGVGSVVNQFALNVANV